MKQKFITWTVERPHQSITLAVLLSLIIASGVRFIHIEDDLMKMLPEDIPSRLLWNEIEDQFGSTEPIFISVGKSGESIFTPQVLAQIWDLSIAFEDLPQVDEVRSLATMNKIFNDDGFMEVGDLMAARDLSADEIAEMRRYLDDNQNISRMMVSRHGDYASLMVLPIPGTSDEEMANAINTVQSGIGDGYEYHIGGLPYVRGIIGESVRSDIVGLMRVGLLLLIVILLLNLRSVPALLMTLVVIVLSAITMVGFFGWVFILTQSDKFNFTLLNSNMPIILLTIATADAVHIITRFFREMRARQDVRASVVATMDVLMLPVFLTSITTMAGFLSLLTSPLGPMMGYGLTVSFGIAWAWFLSVTLLPSVMTRYKWKLSGRALRSAGVFERAIHKIGKSVLRRPRIVLGSGLFILLVSVAGIFMVKVEVNIIKFFKPGSEMRASMDFLDREMYGSSSLAFRVRGDIKSPGILTGMENIQNQLEKESAIGNTLSLATIIAKMHRVVMDDSVEYEVIPETRAKVANLLTLYSMSGDPDDFSSLVDYDYETALITANMRTISTAEMVELVRRLEDRLGEDKPEQMETELSGFPVFLRDLTALLVGSSLRSLTLSLVFVVIISWIFFRSLAWGLLAVIPLASAIVLCFGLMGWVGIELSHVTALLTSIIIGVGVDFAVHFVAQYRHFQSQGMAVDEISQAAIDDVGYPILLNVAAVSVGFSALLASSFVPMNYMGGLVIISMFSAAIGTLTILATVIHLSRKKLAA
ncbi:MAG: MMPL family transporter [Candidatus Marinimicrobia bacterium]|nr:MMPL family transporter [Candidatus Neomarinimicrobiota bacterium]